MHNISRFRDLEVVNKYPAHVISRSNVETNNEVESPKNKESNSIDDEKRFTIKQITQNTSVWKIKPLVSTR